MSSSARLVLALAGVTGLAMIGCDRPDPTSIAPDVVRAERPMDGGTSVDLGRHVFFDKNLSLRGNQACAACHAPEYGFTGPIGGVNVAGSVYPGSVRTRFGGRRPPSAAYAAQSPVLHVDPEEGIWIGGNFWDGRATGELLGNPASDQALGPFLNPVEQALPDPACVVWMVREGGYADTYAAVWGDGPWTIDFPGDTRELCRTEGSWIPLDADDRAAATAAYYDIARSVKDFEASPEVSAFTSKYDAYLRGETDLTEDEAAGLALFEGKAMCSACHPSDGEGALFTDYSYDNLGVPANPLNPVYAYDPGFVDLGLGGVLGDPALYGAHKVPTLRNVAKRPGGAPKAFLHNGVFKSLLQVVHFYNTRDVKPRCDGVATQPGVLGRLGSAPECWPGPEVAENVNSDELGDLGLTPEEEAQLVAFMETLSDGWRR